MFYEEKNNNKNIRKLKGKFSSATLKQKIEQKIMAVVVLEKKQKYFKIYIIRRRMDYFD